MGVLCLPQLVVRLIPRASAASLQKGDVIAFTSPLAAANEQHVLIRRVAALENEEMVSTQGEEEAFTIPPNHCWVLADNERLQPPNVIDSRTFGHIPFNTVLGRVIYSASSASDHGPVQNSPESMARDEAVIEAEVEPEALFSAAGTDNKDSPQ